VAKAGLSLWCSDCGMQLRSVEEAQAHTEVTNHANFVESTEAVLNLVCSDCGKPCLSQTVRSSPPLPQFLSRFPPIRFGGPSIQSGAPRQCPRSDFDRVWARAC
jgi:DNA-directed RNA polymerase subunit RPC12/RpoP